MGVGAELFTGDVYEAEAVEGVETGERLQTASQAENSEAGGKLQDARQTQEVKHGEQFMRVVVQVPQELSSHLTLNSEPDRSHIIIVADRSGSMAGNPWNQVSCVASFGGFIFNLFWFIHEKAVTLTMFFLVSLCVCVCVCV